MLWDNNSENYSSSAPGCVQDEEFFIHPVPSGPAADWSSRSALPHQSCDQLAEAQENKTRRAAECEKIEGSGGGATKLKKCPPPGVLQGLSFLSAPEFGNSDPLHDSCFSDLISPPARSKYWIWFSLCSAVSNAYLMPFLAFLQLKIEEHVKKGAGRLQIRTQTSHEPHLPTPPQPLLGYERPPRLTHFCPMLGHIVCVPSARPIWNGPRGGGDVTDGSPQKHLCKYHAVNIYRPDKCRRRMVYSGIHRFTNTATVHLSIKVNLTANECMLMCLVAMVHFDWTDWINDQKKNYEFSFFNCQRAAVSLHAL